MFAISVGHAKRSGPMRPEEVGGGALSDVIASTVAAEAEDLPETPAAAPTAGVPELIDVLRSWLRNDDLAATGEPVAFVKMESIRRIDGEVIPLLTLPDDRTLTAGSVYVCSYGLGRAVRFDGASTIDALIATLGALEASNLPTVIYVPRDQAFAWLPNGVDDLDSRFEERLELGSGRAVTREAVEEILDSLYREHWRTPTAGGKIWEDSQARVPVELAEGVFQDHVLLGCKLIFASHRTAAELTGVTGRCDVLMFPKKDPPEPQGRAVIEMKVLRSFHYAPRGTAARAANERDNRRAIRKGVGQAMRYGEENGCGVRVLCVCDMRRVDDPAVTEPYAGFGIRHGVVTRRFFMYGSADELGEADLRRAGAPDA